MGLLGALLAVTGSFLWLAVASTLARLFVYAGCTAALPLAQSRSDDPEPLGRATYFSIAAAFAVCLWAAMQSAWPAWRLLIILVAAGTLLFALARMATIRRR